MKKNYFQKLKAHHKAPQYALFFDIVCIFIEFELTLQWINESVYHYVDIELTLQTEWPRWWSDLKVAATVAFLMYRVRPTPGTLADFKKIFKSWKRTRKMILLF